MTIQSTRLLNIVTPSILRLFDARKKCDGKWRKERQDKGTGGLEPQTGDLVPQIVGLVPQTAGLAPLGDNFLQTTAELAWEVLNLEAVFLSMNACLWLCCWVAQDWLNWAVQSVNNRSVESLCCSAHERFFLETREWWICEWLLL